MEEPMADQDAGSKPLKKFGDILDDQLFRKLAWKSAILMVISVCVVMLLGYFLREPITAWAIAAIDVLGALGIFAGVLASDAFGFPVPVSTYLFAAVAADSPIVVILIVTSLASIIGASIAYLVGPYIGRLPVLRTILERFRPRGEAIFERWGVWAVGIAALTPLPFAVFCWLAGIYRMPFVRFFSATLVRAPRVLAYYGFFALGWAGSAVGA